jgi:hypothetical protein
MTVEHHWSLPIIIGWCPNIQEKAIFGGFWLILPEGLDGRCAKLPGIIYT